jgi:hypothetical protein
LFGSIFGNDASGEQASAEGGGQAVPPTGEATQQTPAQTQTTPEPAGEKDMYDDVFGGEEESPGAEPSLDEIMSILGLNEQEEQPAKKPFGNEKITEDEATDLAAKEG